MKVKVDYNLSIEIRTAEDLTGLFGITKRKIVSLYHE
jgi:hypothetical protein